MSLLQLLRRTTPVAAALVVGLVLPTSPAHAIETTPSPTSTADLQSGHHTGRVLVRFRAGTAEGARRVAYRHAGTTRRTTIHRLGVDVLDTAAPSRALSRLQRRADVLWAEPEIVVRRLVEVSSTAERSELSLDEARATDPRFDGAGVRVAVIDDGVFPIADLVGRVVDKGDCSFGGCLPSGGVNALDAPGYGSHGTAVAAIIAAAAGNGVGIVGAAPRATIFAYRVFDDILAGASDTSIASAIMEAADDGADVANLSLGTPFDSQVLRVGDRGAQHLRAAGPAGHGHRRRGRQRWR